MLKSVANHTAKRKDQRLERFLEFASCFKMDDMFIGEEDNSSNTFELNIVLVCTIRKIPRLSFIYVVQLHLSRFLYIQKWFERDSNVNASSCNS